MSASAAFTKDTEPCVDAAAGRGHASPGIGLPAAGEAAEVRCLSEAMRCVLEFHRAFDLPRSRCPTLVHDSLARLRVALLREEVAEFAAAAKAGDIVGIADALADIVYVTYGAAVTYGIDLDAAVAEVHRSNMSKLDHEGRPVLRQDGKVLKSDRYTPPDLAAVLEAQQDLPT